MALLDSPLREEIAALQKKSVEEFSNDRYEKSLDLLLEAWEKLPDPKYSYNDSFYIAKSVILKSIKTEDFETAKKWAEIILHCDPERQGGERYMLAGRAFYHSGDNDSAKILFLNAYIHSGGRLFQNKKYEDFFTLIKDEIPGKMEGSIFKSVNMDITRIFKELENNDIIALQNAGTTQEDGFADCSQLFHKKNEESRTLKGFCFYSKEDLKIAKKQSMLSLSIWGAPDGNSLPTAEVGKIVVELFEQRGYKTLWNNSASVRPLVILEK
jgi:tetratricopeptide (TPR) repeat protein